ncbi:hypothetical protein EYB25_006989 [Talaromyces marneffei]|uniref:uncharacterized protein n=1 Tax=Talaromyces marneffei TaxID=37727 RepID=UPI0012A800BF|nr:uncharacterized protein EYB26_008130 [Talaromyces marneffei]KAE8550761.1 hypothetical protein EYB25_006989 [Talaromyces marneffei]QGA20428.1 hypothetical protein EYB26_008130 [Talaromyces marneffei]
MMQECERLLTQQSDKIMIKKGLAQVCSILGGLKCHIDEESFKRFIDLVLTKSLELTDFDLIGRALLLIECLTSSNITFIAKVIADHGLNSIRSALHSKLKGITHHSYGSRERATPDLGLLYMITREYLSVCTERNLAPSTEVADWQNTTFFTAVSDSLRGSESDGQKLAKYLNEMPILGSFGKIEAYLLDHVENTTFTAHSIHKRITRKQPRQECGRRNDQEPPSKGYSVFQD